MSNASSRIIGGMFGLEQPVASSPSCTREEPTFTKTNGLLLATARSAFALLCSFLHPKTVWLPSYLCGVVMGAFPRESVRVAFYPIDENLTLGEVSWIAEVQPGDMVVFIDYFGFNSWTRAGAEVKARGATVVEDACQALLNKNFCEHSDYVILSPRKFAGVPDGGILLAPGAAPLPDEDLGPAPADWWLRALAASIGRAEFDKHGGKRTWFDLFRETEVSGPIVPCRMSELTRLLIREVVGWSAIARIRRKNFLFLSAELRDLAIFGELPDEVVPLGFPIRFPYRDAIRNRMFREGIFPPVHWPIDGVVPTRFRASHALAHEIMTLPCDQRNTTEDLSRIIDILRNAKEG